LAFDYSAKKNVNELLGQRLMINFALQKYKIFMIQRKQSLFLLLAVASLVGLAFLPIASFIGEKDSLVMYVYKVVSLVPDSPTVFSSMFLLPLLAIVLVTAITSFGTIFMYKNRIRQIRMVRLMVFLLVVAIGLFFLYYTSAMEEATAGTITPELGIYLIPVSILLLFLALRGIIADERLIRSSERLR